MKLEKWIVDRVNTWGLNSTHPLAPEDPNPMSTNARDESDESDDKEGPDISLDVTIRTRHMFNRELVTDTINLNKVHDIMEELERGGEEEEMEIDEGEDQEVQQY